eukprot:1159525-Pelagomonas_calceolata.AAC.5
MSGDDAQDASGCHSKCKSLTSMPCLPARKGLPALEVKCAPHLPAPPVRRACRMRPPPGAGWGPFHWPS